MTMTMTITMMMMMIIKKNQMGWLITVLTVSCIWVTMTWMMIMSKNGHINFIVEHIVLPLAQI